MNKLRMMVVYNNKKGIEKIKDAVKDIEYIEVVGSTKNGKEVYSKILELKPDILFTKFKMKDFDPMKVMMTLGEECPNIKFLSDNLDTDNARGFYKERKKRREKIIRFNFVRELGINEMIEEIEKYYRKSNNIA